MTKRVSLSACTLIMTVIALGVIITLIILKYNEGNILSAGILCGALTIICLASLWYMPLSITATPDGVLIRRPLRIKVLPMDLIESVELCPPSIRPRRVCGSGGWMGYWGWFSRADIGRYFAYYGREADCFLITLRNGRRYMLGCNAPQAITDYIGSLLSNSKTK